MGLDSLSCIRKTVQSISGLESGQDTRYLIAEVHRGLSMYGHIVYPGRSCTIRGEAKKLLERFSKADWLGRGCVFRRGEF